MTKYYWIDTSCDVVKGVKPSRDGVKEVNFEDYITEARHLARRAAERLQSPTDTDFARVFNIIFKTPKTAREPKYARPDLWHDMNGFGSMSRELRTKKSVLDHVIDALKDFANDWERTEDREKSHIRIYNDGGANVAYNSNTGMCFDIFNDIRVEGNPAEECRNTQGVCYSNWVGQDGQTGPDGRENPKRNRIDILPLAWQGVELGYPVSIKALQEDINNQAIPNHPKALDITFEGQFLVTSIIAHEWMHTHAYGFTDGSSMCNPGGETAGWPYIMMETKEQVWENADAMALLMISAGFADLKSYGVEKGGFTLDRSWDSIPGDNDPAVTNEKWDPEITYNNAANGIFMYYEDLTN